MDFDDLMESFDPRESVPDVSASWASRIAICFSWFSSTEDIAFAVDFNFWPFVRRVSCRGFRQAIVGLVVRSVGVEAVAPPDRDEIAGESAEDDESSTTVESPSRRPLIFLERMVSMFFVKTVFGISGKDEQLS